MKSIFNVLLISVLSLYLVGCAAKADPDTVAFLEHQKEMNKPENRAVKTFEMTGEDMVITGVKSIVTREPLAPVNVKMPTTGYDVLNNMIQPVASIAKVGLGVYGAIEIADTIAKAAETVVVQSENQSVQVVDPVIVNPEVVNPEIVNPEIVNPEVISPEVVVVEAPTEWEYPAYPDAPANHPPIPEP